MFTFLKKESTTSLHLVSCSSMNSIKIYPPEIVIDSSNNHQEKLIRRIVFNKQFNKDACNPKLPSLTDVYPSGLINSTFSCKSSGDYNQIGFGSTVLVDLHTIHKVYYGKNDNDTIHYTQSGDMVAVPLWINYINVNTSLNYNEKSFKELSEYMDETFILQGSIELYLDFECCSKSSENTCYQNEHSKKWELKAKCAYGVIQAGI